MTKRNRAFRRSHQAGLCVVRNEDGKVVLSGTYSHFEVTKELEDMPPPEPITPTLSITMSTFPKEFFL